MVYASVIGGCLAAVALFFATQAVRIYNRLVSLDNNCDNGFSQVQIQLKRRYDLIPNLVEAVRGYLVHEQETLEKVIAARNQASKGLEALTKSGSADTAAMSQWMGAESSMMGALGRMNFVIESYPDLKANQNVAVLMEELQSTENKISFARQSFNDWCTTFNVFRQSFPAVAFAGSFGYKTNRQLISFEEESAQLNTAPKVELAAV